MASKREMNGEWGSPLNIDNTVTLGCPASDKRKFCSHRQCGRLSHKSSYGLIHKCGGHDDPDLTHIISLSLSNTHTHTPAHTHTLHTAFGIKHNIDRHVLPHELTSAPLKCVATYNSCQSYTPSHIYTPSFPIYQSNSPCRQTPPVFSILLTGSVLSS